MQELEPFDFGVRVTIHGFVVNQYKPSMIELVVVLNTADNGSQVVRVAIDPILLTVLPFASCTQESPLPTKLDNLLLQKYLMLLAISFKKITRRRLHG